MTEAICTAASFRDLRKPASTPLIMPNFGINLWVMAKLKPFFNTAFWGLVKFFELMLMTHFCLVSVMVLGLLERSFFLSSFNLTFYIFNFILNFSLYRMVSEYLEFYRMLYTDFASMPLALSLTVLKIFFFTSCFSQHFSDFLLQAIFFCQKRNFCQNGKSSKIRKGVDCFFFKTCFVLKS